MSEPPRFVGSIPELYDRHMGPVLFEPYAIETARRLPASAHRVLEIACGTGRVTRHLLARGVDVVATDLNPPMIERAREVVGDHPHVTWRAADAQALPFGDGEFDAAVCQFGIMFVPDKPLAVREMRRVLRPGGTLLLSTWDHHANNPASHWLHLHASTKVPSAAFQAVPFSMGDTRALRDLVAGAGFGHVEVETIACMGEAVSAADLATGFVRGNPLWNQLVEAGADAEAFQRSVAEGLAEQFGDHPCLTPMSAHVATAY